MSDVVEMLEAWEAKEKRDARPIFEIVKWKIGESWYVRVTLPNQAPENIEGFKSEGEASRWVRNESQVWLHARNERR